MALGAAAPRGPLDLDQTQPEYVLARRVLLDALEALDTHRSAVVVAGAQAVYLRAIPGVLTVSDYTTDGDLALDPALLSENPAIERLMREAGFELAEVDEARSRAPGRPMTAPTPSA